MLMKNNLFADSRMSSFIASLKQVLCLLNKSFFVLSIILFATMMSCDPNPPEPGPDDDIDTTVIKTDTTTHHDGDITYQLKEGVYFLTDSMLQHISNHVIDSNNIYAINGRTYGSFHVDGSIPKSMFPQQGSTQYFIVNNRFDIFPDGLIAALYYTEDTGDGYDVHYYTKQLTDAFQSLNIGEQSIPLNTYAKKVVSAKGKEVPFKIAKDASIDKYHLEISGEDWDLPLGLTFTPKMVLDLVLKMQMIIDGGELYTFTSVLESDVAFDAEISATMASMEAEKTFDLCTIYFGAVPVGPLVITPAVEVVGIIGASGELKLSTEISYTEKFRTEVHYDVNNGLSASHQSIENPSPFKCETKPKLSGAVKYGLGVGPTIGVYGKSIAVSFTLDCLLQEEIEWSYNFNDFDLTEDPYVDTHYGGYSNSNFLDPGYSSEYKWALVLKGSASLKGYGFDAMKISTPEVKIDLDKRTILPQISRSYTYELDGDYLNFHTWIKTKALEYPNMKLIFFGTGNGNTFVVNDEMMFTYTEGDIQALENGADSVEITASGKLDQSIQYWNAAIAFELNGQYYPVMGEYRTNFDVHDTKYVKIIKELLSDIRSNSAGEWEGCNWDQPIAFNEMKYIEFRDYGGAGGKSLKITIPQEWELSSDFKVNSHCEELVDSAFYWNLELYDMDHAFSTVDIEDPCCSYILTGENVESLIMRTKIWDGTNRKLSYLPEHLKNLDISGSSITNFTINAASSVRELETLKLDNCNNLTNLHVCMHKKTTQISANNCPKLASVAIDSLHSNFSWTYDCKTLRFDNSQIGELSVSGLSRLENLYCDDSGLTSLSLSNLPAIKDLRCHNNKSLTGVMLPIFDEMFSRGYAPMYDQRYTYNTDGTVKSDLGYGFYYEDEPGCGYHRK